MLRHYGDKLALQLGEKAKFYIPFYEKARSLSIVFVACIALRDKKKKFVKFERLAGQWIYFDITSKVSAEFSTVRTYR